MPAGVKTCLAYLECTCLLLFFLRGIGAERIEAANLGTFEVVERLGVVPVASVEGWRLLARATRHLLRVMEDGADPRLWLVQQLYEQVAGYAARVTARKGDGDGAAKG
jgi:hypothetical protein